MPEIYDTTARDAQRAVRVMRLDLIEAIAHRLERYPLRQGELAELLGIARPRLNRLLKREVELFSLDALAAIAVRAGLAVKLGATRPYGGR